MKLRFIEASNEYKEGIIEMLDEWKHFNDTHDGANRSPSAIFIDYSDFDNYIYQLNIASKKVTEPKVPSSTYFVLDEDRNVFVGAISIRHYLNEGLRNGGGHIGDGVRPNERRKGYGTEIIRLGVIKAHELGIKDVMISAHEINIGSKKAIINNGGVYERTVIEDGMPLDIYWIKG